MLEAVRGIYIPKLLHIYTISANCQYCEHAIGNCRLFQFSIVEVTISEHWREFTCIKT